MNVIKGILSGRILQSCTGKIRVWYRISHPFRDIKPENGIIEFLNLNVGSISRRFSECQTGRLWAKSRTRSSGS